MLYNPDPTRTHDAPAKVNHDAVPVNDDDVRRQMYERLARRHALAEAEEQARHHQKR